MIFSKKSLFLFLFLSLTFSFLSGQTVSVNASDRASLNENEITLNMTESPESSLLIGESQGKFKSSVWPFIEMILVLLVVVAAIYGVLYFLKRRGAGTGSNDQFLRRVAYLSLGQGKSVEVVTLVDHGAYLIGVTEGGINLISEVKDPELIQAMNLYADKTSNSSKPKNFADILDIFMPGGPREKQSSAGQNVFSSGEAGVDQLFETQTKRLNENE